MRLKRKETIALVFSDLHIGDWNNFETRCDTALSILEYIAAKASYKKVPMLFCGDLFDKPDRISNKLMGRVIKAFDKVEDITNNIALGSSYSSYMLAISGNHDMDTISKLNITPKSWGNYFAIMFPWISMIDYKGYAITDDVKVYGIPFIDHNNGAMEVAKTFLEDDFQGKKVLLLHTDYPGALDNTGYEVGTSENLDNSILDQFDLVLCGHIHKPQHLRKNIYMIGAPYQQSRSDIGASLGYWKLYSDLTMKFMPLDGYPEFIDVDSPDKVGTDGNYYTVIAQQKEEEVVVENTVNLDMSRTRLVKNYLKMIGEKDKDKKRVLIDIINKADGNVH